MTFVSSCHYFNVHVVGYLVAMVYMTGRPTETDKWCQSGEIMPLYKPPAWSCCCSALQITVHCRSRDIPQTVFDIESDALDGIPRTLIWCLAAQSSCAWSWTSFIHLWSLQLTFVIACYCVVLIYWDVEGRYLRNTGSMGWVLAWQWCVTCWLLSVREHLSHTLQWLCASSKCSNC
jgi:hypothetical protein